jgi:hypothetical protein
MLAPEDEDTSSNPSTNGRLGTAKGKRKKAFRKRKKGLQSQINKIKKKLR